MMIDFAHYKEKLHQLRNDIMNEKENAKDASKPVELDQTLVGRVSRIDAMQQQQMALATKRRRDLHIRQIDQALERIENGDFGYCVNCDEAINEKRLNLNPTILTCIECANH